jgi:hypothetical protein
LFQAVVSQSATTFLIFRGHEYGDFELQFEYQVKGYSSGVQYRSAEKGKWSIAGYKADFEDRWHKTDAGLTD